MSVRSRLLRIAFAAIPCLILVAAQSGHAQTASALIREGDPFPAAGPGHVVNALNNTAVNHVAGFAVNLNSSDGTSTLSHIWGDPAGVTGALMRSEGTFGSLVQTSFESFYGMADDGSVAYSASGTGGPVGSFDSVWKDDTPVMVEGDPYPHAPDTWWRFGSRPGITAGGVPYFVGGLTYTQGGTTQNYGLFYGMTGAPVFIGGDMLPGLPAALATSSTISFDYRYSASGAHHIGEVAMSTGSTTNDNAMVIDAEGLVLGGSLVQEGTLVPPMVGGNGAENWDNFDFTGISDAGWYFFTGDTDGATTSDEIIVKNGSILYREGDMIGGETVSGSIGHAYMNEDGDIAYQWTVQGGALEALFINDQLVLVEGAFVDLDGDGFVEPTSILVDFTGISALTLSDRDLSGMVRAYFTADIDTAGTTSTTDDVEGFFCLPWNMGPTAVQLSNLQAVPMLRSQGVVLSWTTSAEVEHQGFHVYRADAPNADYERLTDELIKGRSPYSWTDTTALARRNYWYMVGAVDLSGEEVRYGPVQVTTPGWTRESTLAASEPNPFTERTRISFTLDRESRVQLTVLDVAGRKIATLAEGLLPTGEHERWWDGRTNDGRSAAAGVYFYRLDTGTSSVTRKMVRLGSE